MRPTLGPKTFRHLRSLALRVAVLLAALLAIPGARAESPRCTDLRAQIAKESRSIIEAATARALGGAVLEIVRRASGRDHERSLDPNGRQEREGRDK